MRHALPGESAPGPADRATFIRQEFQCNEPTQFSVLGLVDHSHATAAELFDDAVVGYGLLDHCLWLTYRGRFILRAV